MPLYLRVQKKERVQNRFEISGAAQLTEGIPPCSVDGDALPTHHHSSDDAGGGDCNSPNGADLDSQSTPGLPVPPRPDPTCPELPSLAPSISHVEFGSGGIPVSAILVTSADADSSLSLAAGIPLWPLISTLFHGLAAFLSSVKSNLSRVHAALDVRSLFSVGNISMAEQGFLLDVAAGRALPPLVKF
ncbi:hypothetical protein Nepgr_026651 [Nepenthes gracilis]|uniref:Uncharacterized protein n=1 Tax=Nepenthes gracilis TaxID=150966 RepID=A0AAD3Y0R8_NEPGR|nr:hypothetical protein Nepgr_026651 [Nepenthes gracilis]